MKIQHQFLNIKDFPLSIRYIENNKRKNFQYHWHEQIEIQYIKAGGMNFICNESTKWLYPGDIAIVNWCEPHSTMEFLDGSKHYLIQIDITSEIFKMIKKDVVYINYYKNNKELNSILDEIIYEYNEMEKGYELIVIGGIIRLFGQLNRLNNVNQEYSNIQHKFKHIKLIFTYIHENFTNDIRLEDISQKLEISKSHMCRIFKDYTSITINDYINKLRFNYAISLLKNGHSVTETSMLVGFNDYNYFSRAFKNEMGYLPSSIKKS